MPTDAQIIATLRQWALDAADRTSAANWVGTTYTAAKDQTLKTAVQRLGTMCTNMADILEGNRFGS